MEVSPFPFQGPLTPDLVTGREGLVVDLSRRLTERRLTALLGPRRYGKTSVLRKVAHDLAQVGPEAIWIDLWGMASMDDLAAAFDLGLAGTHGPLRRALDDVAGSFSLDLGVAGLELRRASRDRPNAGLTLRALLRSLVRLAKERPLILVLDEFSGIANVDHGAAVLRTELQHHYRDLGIVFAGSQPSTMQMLFEDRSQPFFAQADLLMIGPLSGAAICAQVEDGFDGTGRAAGTVVDPLVAFAEGHPQRAMQLADAVWQRTDEGAAATNATWAAALANVRETSTEANERLFDALPVSQQKVLRVIASGGSIFGSAAHLVSLSEGTARSAVRGLVDHGHLVKPDRGYRVVDPVFSDWIRRQFAP